ncbi:MAG: hypothetical protein ACE5D6_05405, partial [Candidatus Zixiibacteriota bacterium]
DNDEVIISYCDFSSYWKYEEFLDFTRSRNSDGCIPAYKGFHPHMLWPTNYAFMRDDNQRMLEIREKTPFTTDRMAEYASNGVYYFKKGSYVKKYFQQNLEKGINYNGEAYISLVYNLLNDDGLNISIYEIQHMLQWGTPTDLEEYKQWSNVFKRMITERDTIKTNENTINLIPLAGKGLRFQNENYKDPKPLIEVSGKPMVLQAADFLPKSKVAHFIALEEHLQKYPLADEIIKEYPFAKIFSVKNVTEGQACTCALGLSDEDMETPVMIGACDNGMHWDANKYSELLDNPNVDVIVWTFRNNTSSQRNPNMYGWVSVDKNNNALSVSVKIAISDEPKNDHAIIGAFYFRKTKIFIDELDSLIKKNERINNEFYVDSCINELIKNHYVVKVFEVDDYIPWGTPNDLRTYEYWQSFFHKCKWHPYSFYKDPRIPPEKRFYLEKKSNLKKFNLL